MGRLQMLSKLCLPSQQFYRYKGGTNVIQIERSRRSPSFCEICRSPNDAKPCFDLNNISIERGNQCHAKLIRSFIYTHYWPREPSVTSLWMSLNSAYLAVLTEKYAHSGDRLLAFERQTRTGERKLVGVLIANMTFPWVADELEEWAHFTNYIPDRNRMYFNAHCLRGPNLFKKFNCDYIYEIEVLVTASEVTGQGVATLLLRTALAHALELRHPLIQLVATNTFANKCCDRCNMRNEWSMKYTDFIDEAGVSVFYARWPHNTVNLYIKPFSHEEASALPCEPPFL